MHSDRLAEIGHMKVGPSPRSRAGSVPPLFLIPQRARRSRGVTPPARALELYPSRSHALPGLSPFPCVHPGVHTARDHRTEPNLHQTWIEQLYVVCHGAAGLVIQPHVLTRVSCARLVERARGPNRRRDQLVLLPSARLARLRRDRRDRSEQLLEAACSDSRKLRVLQQEPTLEHHLEVRGMGLPLRSRGSAILDRVGLYCGVLSRGSSEAVVCVDHACVRWGVA